MGFKNGSFRAGEMAKLEEPFPGVDLMTNVRYEFDEMADFDVGDRPPKISVAFR